MCNDTHVAGTRREKGKGAEGTRQRLDKQTTRERKGEKRRGAIRGVNNERSE